MTSSAETAGAVDAASIRGPQAGPATGGGTAARPRALPDLADTPRSLTQRVLVGVFVGLPLIVVAVAVSVAWGSGLTWHDAVLGVVFYCLSGLGATTGYHRYFTHRSFKATRWLKIALAVFGGFAIEGPVLNWVADHRRHHKYSDRDGDPHSPWRYGDDWRALSKGLLFAHIGWLFDPNKTSKEKFCPDLLADPDIRRINRGFAGLVAASLLLPPLIGGLWSMSWHAAFTAFLWASLVRVALLHHVTWSINSICHTFGREDFEVRDRSRNVAWLAILSFGESWHNLHHADPTCARHGVLKGQIDATARVIWLLEKLGWAYDVRWPDARRLAAKRPATATRKLGSMAARSLSAGSAAARRLGSAVSPSRAVAAAAPSRSRTRGEPAG